MSSAKAFGTFAKAARVHAGLGLREASRRMAYSASFLSRIEAGDERPSPKLLAAMAVAYDIEIEMLTALMPEKAASTYGHVLRNNPELRALFRVGLRLECSEINAILRDVLTRKWRLKGEALKAKLANLKKALP